ncbi:hypothetical protein EV363DRAFT_403306 [Boletus edulis]|nr:hypothetical protein EV363DRAFT_403306 [Boletus edulis]
MAATSLTNTNSTKILELEDELATQLRDAAAGRELVGSRDIRIWTRKTRAVSSMGHYLCRCRASPSGVRGRRTDRKTWSLSPRCLCLR